MDRPLSTAERKYLLREGHLLGFAMGLVLSRWLWVAAIWMTVVATLWWWSVLATNRRGPT